MTDRLTDSRALTSANIAACRAAHNASGAADPDQCARRSFPRRCRVMNIDLEKAARTTAWLACAAVVGMIAIFFATGVGQDPLQFVHPSDEYGRLLLENPAALRACLALDNLFIVFYASMFVALAVVLDRAGSPRVAVASSIGLLLLVALLDMVENFHFMVMLAEAEQGSLPSSREISLQVLESLFKFHVSYLGLFLLGFALPRRTAKQRLLGNLSWFVQLPVGVLIYVVPHSVAVPLVFARFAYFVTALLLIATIFRAGQTRTASPRG